VESKIGEGMAAANDAVGRRNDGGTREKGPFARGRKGSLERPRKSCST